MKENYKKLYETVEYLFLNEKKISSKQLSKLHWFEVFEKFIKEKNIDLYNDAKKNTNKLENNNYFTEEELKKFKS